MKRLWHKISSLALLLSLCLAVPAPLLRAENPPQKIDVTKLNARVNDVVIPVPSEIFNALDKLGGNPNWKTEIGEISKARPTNQAQIGLLLGVVIADGFIAVQAKEAGRVKDIGRRVLDLSKSLGVNDVVVSHCNSINEAADKGNWEAIRSEFDKAQSSVRSAMDKLKSQDVSELISIGGWLRGTDALTSLIRKDFTADRAELLHQPELLQTFDEQMRGMHANVKSNAIVLKVQEALKEIKPMIGSSNLDQKAVEKINTLTSELLKTISP